MSKDAEKTTEPNEWIFPEMDLFHEEENEFGDMSQADDIDDEDDDFEPTKAEEKKNKEAVDPAIASLVEKSAEVDRKNDLLKAILTKVKEPLAFLDDQIINILQDIIKKITVKIINKEISADPDLVKKMIDDLKSLIYTQNGLINIYLSEEDHKRIQFSAENAEQAILIDKTLAEGDIVISSKDTEIRALLNDRIDLLMGTLHD